jgi:aspartate racemase
MKKIGIVGGVGWPSTIDYYAGICRRAGDHLPEMSIESLDLATAISYRGIHWDESSWKQWDAYYRNALRRLEASGAEVAVIASNSPHHRLEAIVTGVQIPVIDMFEVMAAECARFPVPEALILGTELTMDSQRLRDKFRAHGRKAFAPKAAVRAMTAELIADLQREQFARSEERIEEIVGSHFGGASRDNSLVCLACTELPLAFPGHKELAVFEAHGVRYINSTMAHVNAVCEFALDAGAVGSGGPVGSMPSGS